KHIRDLEDKARDTTFDRVSFELLKKRMTHLESEKLSLMSDKITLQTSLDQIKAVKELVDKKVAHLEKELNSVKAEKAKAYVKASQLEKELSLVKAERVTSEAKAARLGKNLKEMKELALNESVRNTKERLDAREDTSKLEIQLRDTKNQLEQHAPLASSHTSSSTSSADDVIEPVMKKIRTEEEVNDEVIAMLLDVSSVGDGSEDGDDDYVPAKKERAQVTDGFKTPRKRGERSGERKERFSTGTGKNGKKEKAANTCNKIELIGKIIRASEVLHDLPLTEEELEGMPRYQRERLLIIGGTGRQLKPRLPVLNVNNAMCNLRNALKWYERKLLIEEQGEEVVQTEMPKPSTSKLTPKTPKAKMPVARQAAAVQDFSDFPCEALEAELIKRYHSLESTVTIEKLRNHDSHQNTLFLASCIARSKFNNQKTEIMKNECRAILKKLFVYWGKDPINDEEEDRHSEEA
ncbi:hypothetical protein PENTCL1PPCAC_9577, partial [Pristionchus entomophagus]